MWEFHHFIFRIQGNDGDEDEDEDEDEVDTLCSRKSLSSVDEKCNTATN